MYCKNENQEIVYYEFIGWVRDSEKFMEVMNDAVKMPLEVREYLLDEVYNQAKKQGLDKSWGDGGWLYPDYYLKSRQECLENTAKAVEQFANKLYRTKEKQLFIYGPWLGGVYVFKKVS